MLVVTTEDRPGWEVQQYDPTQRNAQQQQYAPLQPFQGYAQQQHDPTQQRGYHSRQYSLEQPSYQQYPPQ